MATLQLILATLVCVTSALPFSEWAGARIEVPQIDEPQIGSEPQIGMQINIDEESSVEYLKQFGYLSAESDDLINNGDAFRKFQEYNGLEITGSLSDATKELMQRPRCGMPDFKDGDLNEPYNAYYKWSNYEHLTIELHTLPSKTTAKVSTDELLVQSISRWDDVSGIDFVPLDEGAEADINVSWEQPSHGDGFDFDTKTLAHAYLPYGEERDGQVHFNDIFTWTDDNKDYNQDWVGTHEFGHALGLSHSDLRSAVMYPNYPYPFRDAGFELGGDDITRIRALYGPN